jgi:uncharacterized membrane-anchored protein YjiN (DUF445 family)
MQWRASALLVAAAVVFVVARIATDGDGWAGYVEAAAEAAMVGGLADWFAVTALFRHPLRLPIPHTAIIPNRKDQIGASLGAFVESNFLDPETIGDRVRHGELGARLGHWLSQPANATRTGQQLGGVVRGLGEVLSDDEVGGAIEHAVLARAEQLPVGPMLGRALEVAIEGGHHQAAFDASLAAVGRLVAENHVVLRQRIYKESPWWVPEAIDDRVFDKITGAVERLIAEVTADPNHELRSHVDRRARELAVRLAGEPDLGERAESVKREILAHPAVRSWVGSLWVSLKTALLEEADNPDSELRRRVEAGLVNAGERLLVEPALRAKVDDWLARAAGYVAEQARGEAAALIATTVARWDAQETADRIEVQVGRDLQFIRINGTLVGGLAGLAIHALANPV